MKRMLLSSVAAFLFLSSFGQSSSAEERAVYASGGSTSYTSISAEKYKPGSQYVVIKFQKAGQLPADKGWAALKAKLQKKNIEVIDLEGASEADIKKALSAYGMTATITDQHLKIQSDKVSGQANCSTAVVVVEGKVPRQLLIGDYEKQLKLFFGFISVD
jgi:hypothetical protein